MDARSQLVYTDKEVRDLVLADAKARMRAVGIGGSSTIEIVATCEGVGTSLSAVPVKGLQATVSFVLQLKPVDPILQPAKRETVAARNDEIIAGVTESV